MVDTKRQYDNYPNENWFTCPHTIDRPHPDSKIIYLGDSNQLVLCRRCYMLLVGEMAKDIVKELKSDLLKEIQNRINYEFRHGIRR
jgi:hypothetical protein